MRVRYQRMSVRNEQQKISLVKSALDKRDGIQGIVVLV